MFFIYADKDLNDVKVVNPSLLDISYGANDNDFEATFALTSENVFEAGSYLYREGTEYGGIIDSISPCPNSNTIVYNGRTWHGILQSKVVEPDTGESHLIVSGELYSLTNLLIERCELDSLFVAPSASSGIYVSNFQFNRYVYLFDALRSLYKSVGYKPKISFLDHRVEITATGIKSYNVKFDVSIDYRPVNHLICLGQGENEERLVIDLYADADGNVSQTQTFFGIDERTETYDYTNANEETLISNGTKRLQELQTAPKATSTGELVGQYELGDELTSYEPITDLEITSHVEQIIYQTNSDGHESISYEASTPQIQTETL